MSQLRLLKRLSHWQKSGKSNYSTENWDSALVSDIESLLNTQEGNALIDQEMGMADLKSQFQSHSAPDIESLQKQLHKQIAAYETRLEHFDLAYIEDNKDPTCLCWKLTASLNKQFNNLPFMANIKLLASGQVTVETAV